MKIYYIPKDLYGHLHKISDDPLEWENAIINYMTSCNHTDSAIFKELEGCDVLWSTQADPQRHKYIYYSPAKNYAFHAIMVNNGAVIPSMVNPGTFIKVKDEISMWEKYLWINDRGYDSQTGNLVYGNSVGVPYKLKRVASILSRAEDRERVVVDKELSWTLGENYRTDDIYEEKRRVLLSI